MKKLLLLSVCVPMLLTAMESEESTANERSYSTENIMKLLAKTGTLWVGNQAWIQAIANGGRARTRHAPMWDPRVVAQKTDFSVSHDESNGTVTFLSEIETPSDINSFEADKAKHDALHEMVGMLAKTSVVSKQETDYATHCTVNHVLNNGPLGTTVTEKTHCLTKMSYDRFKEFMQKYQASQN